MSAYYSSSILVDVVSLLEGSRARVCSFNLSEFGLRILFENLCIDRDPKQDCWQDIQHRNYQIAI